jgi:hypothetical protein
MVQHIKVFFLDFIRKLLLWQYLCKYIYHSTDNFLLNNLLVNMFNNFNNVLYFIFSITVKFRKYDHGLPSVYSLLIAGSLFFEKITFGKLCGLLLEKSNKLTTYTVLMFLSRENLKKMSKHTT